MAQNQVDVAGRFGGELTIKSEEHPDERAARLRSIRRSELIEDCKGVAIFIVLIAGVSAVGAIAAYEGIFDPSAQPDTRRWSQTVLSSLIAAAVSFVIGRKVGK